MASPRNSLDHPLASILVCPQCHGELLANPQHWECVKCGTAFPVYQGVVHFATPVSDQPAENRDVAFRQRYEWQYQAEGDAEQYAKSFKEKPRKRQRTRRELAIMECLLAGRKDCEFILDIPCGGGRLSGPLAACARVLAEADIAPAQLKLALAHNLGNQTGIIASALTLPIRDMAVDGAVCARLSHHLPDPGERKNLLNELLRVSSQFVIFSFTDRSSIQSFGRKLRGKALNPCAMAVDDVVASAAEQGFRLDRVMTVSNIGPRHRYALLVRN